MKKTVPFALMALFSSAAFSAPSDPPALPTPPVSQQAVAPQAAAAQSSADAFPNAVVKKDETAFGDRSDSHDSIARQINQLELRKALNDAKERSEPKKEVVVQKPSALPPLIGNMPTLPAAVINPDDEFKIIMLGSYGFKGNLMAEVKINGVAVQVQKGTKVPSHWLVSSVDGSSMTLVDQKAYKVGKTKYSSKQMKTLYVSPAEAASAWASEKSDGHSGNSAAVANGQKGPAPGMTPAQIAASLPAITAGQQPAASAQPSAAPFSLPPLPR